MLIKSSDSLYEIGGYFELELPDYGDPFPDRLKYQSARAALRAMLECAKIKLVYLPVYICEAVSQAVTDAHSSVQWYSLDGSLYPKGLPKDLEKGSIVLYVNYFGLCDASVKRLLQEYPRRQVVIDNSQALFAPHENALATIYSARKFMGVPDGGLLATNEPGIKPPDTEDTDSIDRMRAMLIRSAYPANNGYDSYLKAESTLTNTRPIGMSRLTNRLISSIDVGEIKSKRRKNFLVLAKKLDEYNKQSWRLEANTVPLCYPLLIDSDVGELRKKLIEKGIYTPSYWPEVKLRAVNNSLEYHLSFRCIFLPCDQRYTAAQMSSLAQEVIALMHNKT